MSELYALIGKYEEQFGIEIPDGKIDEGTLIRLLKKALTENKPIQDTSSFVE